MVLADALPQVEGLDFALREGVAVSSMFVDIRFPATAPAAAAPRMLDLLSASMRGSSFKRRIETPVYVVADVARSPQELNSDRCTSLVDPVFAGNEHSATSRVLRAKFGSDRFAHSLNLTTTI